MRLGDQAAQIGVALLVFGEQGQVDGPARLINVQQTMLQRDLDAGDRLNIGRRAGLGELYRPVQPVVIGDRQRAVAQLGRLQGHLLGQRGALEKRVAGMQMQLDRVGQGLHIRRVEHTF